MRRMILPITLALALILGTGLVQAPAMAEPPSQTYLVVVKGKKLPADFADRIAQAGGTVTYAMPEIGMAVVTGPSTGFPGKIAILGDLIPAFRPSWQFPEMDLMPNTASPPNAPEDDFYFNLQWGLEAIEAPEAWEEGARGAGVRVAVLDDGIDSDHPDLAPNLNTDLSISFVPGEPFEYTMPDPYSHGTWVSGIIAAADNGWGTIGVAPEAELVMIKVLSSDHTQGSFLALIQGIYYAGLIQADVINMSLGARIPKQGFCDDSGVCIGRKGVKALRKALKRATRFARKRGAILIASAGNEAINLDQDKDYITLPAEDPNVLAISATGPLGWALDPDTDLDVPAWYTNYGRSSIDFAAPGGNLDFDLYYAWQQNPNDPANYCTVAGVTNLCAVFDWVLSTGSQGGYYWASGTSGAAPHVAGVAALIIGQAGGSMKPAKVEKRLRKGADDLGPPGRDDYYGRGRVNAEESLPH